MTVQRHRPVRGVQRAATTVSVSVDDTSHHRSNPGGHPRNRKRVNIVIRTSKRDPHRVRFLRHGNEPRSRPCEMTTPHGARKLHQSASRTTWYAGGSPPHRSPCTGSIGHLFPLYVLCIFFSHWKCTWISIRGNYFLCAQTCARAGRRGGWYRKMGDGPHAVRLNGAMGGHPHEDDAHGMLVVDGQCQAASAPIGAATIQWGPFTARRRR